MIRMTVAAAALACFGLANVQPAVATPFSFSTGSPNGLIATATRPADTSTGAFEIESADDFILAAPTTLTSATFTGLIPANSSVKDVVVEIYRVFPNDSNLNRVIQVPTRNNSPSDVAFDSRDSSSGGLIFATSTLQSSFTANNSVRPNGITLGSGGDGQVSGKEVEFDVTFTNPFALPADHYFFVPQVELDTGDFLWLSAPKPITGGTGAFVGDLQSWTRDAKLDPDWLRVGTDIVGAGAFNAAFSLAGVVPEPDTLAVLGTGLLGLAFLRRSRPRR
jgi:hypothetical protein